MATKDKLPSYEDIWAGKKIKVPKPAVKRQWTRKGKRKKRK